MFFILSFPFSRNETHKYICTFGYEEGPERYCPAKNLSCGVLPPTECPGLPPVLSFECLELVCDLAWSEAQTISPPSPPLPNSTLPAIPTVPNSTLPAMPPIPSNMVKDSENSTDWIFFIGGTLFAVFFLLLCYVFYKHCCKKEQQLALPFFNRRAPRERREEEKIAVVADDKRGEPVRNEAPIRSKPKIQTLSQLSLNVSAEEINPQIISPTGSLDRNSVSSAADSVASEQSKHSSGSRVGEPVLSQRQNRTESLSLASSAGIVPIKFKKAASESSEDSLEADTDSAGSKIEFASIEIPARSDDPSKTDESSAPEIISPDKLSIAIEQAKKKNLKCK